MGSRDFPRSFDHTSPCVLPSIPFFFLISFTSGSNFLTLPLPCVAYDGRDFLLPRLFHSGLTLGILIKPVFINVGTRFGLLLSWDSPTRDLHPTRPISVSFLLRTHDSKEKILTLDSPLLLFTLGSRPESSWARFDVGEPLEYVPFFQFIFTRLVKVRLGFLSGQLSILVLGESKTTPCPHGFLIPLIPLEVRPNRIGVGRNEHKVKRKGPGYRLSRVVTSVLPPTDPPYPRDRRPDLPLVSGIQGLRRRV